MSFHRSGPPGAVAVSYSTNTMAPLSPSRRYSSGNNSTSTATIGSATNATKFLTYRSAGPIDRINHSTSTSSYRLSSRRTHYSPARSVSSYSDAGSVASAAINLPPKYSSTSTSSASSTTSSSTSSNARERNGSCSLTPAEFYAKYSPTSYIPNIHGSSGSLSTSSSTSSTLNGHCRPLFTPSSSTIGLAELHGGDERDNFSQDRWSNRQLKRRNNPINTVLTGHDQVDSATAPSEVKQQQKQHNEGNIVENDINRVNDNDNNNGYDHDCNRKDFNVARINKYDGINDKDDDNRNHHHYDHSTLADGTQTYSTTSPLISSPSTYSTVSSPLSSSSSSLLSSISTSNPTPQFLNPIIAPSISNTRPSITINTTITNSTTTVTTVTATAYHTSATSDVSFAAATTDPRASSWIETPTNTNNTNLLTNNNDHTWDEFDVIKQTVNNELSSSMINTTQWTVNNVDVVDRNNRRDSDTDGNDELSDTNDSISRNSVNLADDAHAIKYPVENSGNDIRAGYKGILDENIRLTNKPADNHGNDSSKPSTSRRTPFLSWDDSLNGDSFNSSTSTNTSTVPVGVHQAIYHEINDQIDENPTSRPPRNRNYSRRDDGYGLNGLRNIGNTCFMNSVIQCLSNTRPLLEYLLTEQYLNHINTTTSSMKGALIKAFAQVIHELWESSGDRVVNTASLKTQIQRFAPRFMGYAQQDAQEFLRYLLEGLHEDVNRVTIKPQPLLTDIPDNYSDSLKAAESWKRYLHSEDSTIVDVFVGQLRSSLTCTSCDHVSVTLDPFWDLSLPIPSRSGTVRLNQCLEHFTKVETLDGDEKPICSKCQMRTKCTKSFSIQKFPKILVIHLKRFSPTERFRAKLSVLVDFPLNGLDLSAFAAPGVRGCTYNLYGVANHSGTPYSGHYTAYCKHPYSNDWHEYNDSRVSSVSTSSVVSGEAYVLFYEQQPLNHHL